MKKSNKYMSDEDFTLLLESLNQALQYERGERNDLRVTVLASPPNAKAKAARPKKPLKRTIAAELEDLSKDERQIKQTSSASDPSLEEMLARITPENLHAEIDWGAPVGREVW